MKNDYIAKQLNEYRRTSDPSVGISDEQAEWLVSFIYSLVSEVRSDRDREIVKWLEEKRGHFVYTPSSLETYTGIYKKAFADILDELLTFLKK